MANIVDTDKRLRSWGLRSECVVLARGAVIVDLGKAAHLSNPPGRGIHIVAEGKGFDAPQRALSEARSLDIQCRQSCSSRNQCWPDAGAVKGTDGSWRPAVRPHHQRP